MSWRTSASREVKRRREAIEAYEQAGREDRAARERDEQALLEAYLPAALADTEVDALIDQAMAETGATGPGDLGKVMGLVMARARGSHDEANHRFEQSARLFERAAAEAVKGDDRERAQKLGEQAALARDEAGRGAGPPAVARAQSLDLLQRERELRGRQWESWTSHLGRS